VIAATTLDWCAAAKHRHSFSTCCLYGDKLSGGTSSPRRLLSTLLRGDGSALFSAARFRQGAVYCIASAIANNCCLRKERLPIRSTCIVLDWMFGAAGDSTIGGSGHAYINRCFAARELCCVEYGECSFTVSSNDSCKKDPRSPPTPE